MTDDQFLALPYRPNAGVVLLNPQGRVFAGRRIDTDGDAWQMPQGGIDKGEAAEAAAYRELEEETGVLSGKTELLAALPDWIKYDFPRELAARLWVSRSGEPRYRGQQQRWFLLRFTGEDSDVNIATKHPEFCEWRWMQPEDLIAHIVPFKRPIYQQVFAGFQPFL